MATDKINEEALARFLSEEVRDDAGNVVIRPPKQVREILRNLTASGAVAFEDGQPVVDTSRKLALAAREYEALNRFAAEVAGVNECKVRAVYGCMSCDNVLRKAGKMCFYIIYRAQIVTDCGDQCWECGRDLECMPD